MSFVLAAGAVEFSDEAWATAPFGSRKWRKLWGEWAKENHGHMWTSDWDSVPAPAGAL